MMGLSPQLYVFPGLTLHVQPTAAVNHTLAGTPGMAGAGTWSLPLMIPNNTFLLNTSFYFQGMYLDPNGPFGVSATAGLKLQVR
jgi:hypothetical protein